MGAGKALAPIDRIVTLESRPPRGYVPLTMTGHVYAHPWKHVVSLTDAKARLGELVRDAADGEVLVVRRSKAAAVVLSNERWWNILEEMEDLEDRVALLRWQIDPGDEVTLRQIEPRLGREAEYDVLLTRECVEQLEAVRPPWRWHLCLTLDVLSKNPRPFSSRPIAGLPSLPGARRYQNNSRRLAYTCESRTLTVVRIGRWLVRPEWDRPRRKRGFS